MLTNFFGDGVVEGKALSVTNWPSRAVASWKWVHIAEVMFLVDAHFKKTFCQKFGVLSKDYNGNDSTVQMSHVDINGVFHNCCWSEDFESVAYVPAGWAMDVIWAVMSGVSHFKVNQITGVLWPAEQESYKGYLEDNLIWNESHTDQGTFSVKGIHITPRSYDEHLVQKLQSLEGYMPAGSFFRVGSQVCVRRISLVLGLKSQKSLDTDVKVKVSRDGLVTVLEGPASHNLYDFEYEASAGPGIIKVTYLDK